MRRSYVDDVLSVVQILKCHWSPVARRVRRACWPRMKQCSTDIFGAAASNWLIYGSHRETLVPSESARYTTDIICFTVDTTAGLDAENARLALPEGSLQL